MGIVVKETVKAVELGKEGEGGKVKTGAETVATAIRIWHMTIIMLIVMAVIYPNSNTKPLSKGNSSSSSL